MAWLLLFSLVLLTLSHWLFEPLLRGISPALASTGLGWVALALALWLLAGASSGEPPHKPGA